MPTSTELLSVISTTMGLSESHVANTYRAVRGSGAITAGGRGRNAASMSPMDASVLVSALCGIDRQQDAADFLSAVEKCCDGEGHTFLQDLARLFETGIEKSIIVTVEIPRVRACIGKRVYETKRPLRFQTETDERDRRTLISVRDFTIARSFTEATVTAISELFRED